jgi:hypothetical protein
MEAPAHRLMTNVSTTGQGGCEWVQVRELAEQRRVPSGHGWRGEAQLSASHGLEVDVTEAWPARPKTRW